MISEWIVPYFAVLLQVLAGLVFLRSRSEEAFAHRIFGALFILNAGVTAILAAPREYAIWLHSDPGWTTRIFRALDAPTGPLLLAFLAARGASAWGRRAAWALVAVGIVQALAELPFHAFMDRNEHLLRSLPFYAGLGIGAWVLSAGATWERWIALALLARGLYWGTAGVTDLFVEGWGEEPAVTVNRLGLAALAAACVAAVVRFAKAEGEPRFPLAIPVLLIGPAASLLESAVRFSLPPEAHFRYGAVVLLNLLTLSLVRPVLAILGLSRPALLPALARTTLATGLAVLTAALLPPFRLAEMASPVGQAAEYGFGLCVGLLALAGLEAASPLRGAQGDAPSRRFADPHPQFRSSPAAPRPPAPIGGPVRPPEVAVPPPTEDDAPLSRTPSASPVEAQALAPGEPAAPARPQWQLLLLALRGSYLPTEEEPRGDARLTQKFLVERLGIGAPRISTLVRALHEDAVPRLDAYAPGWRTELRGNGPPALVHQHRGAVPGSPGVWVYYRLTRHGEYLAAAIGSAGGNSRGIPPHVHEGAQPLPVRGQTGPVDPTGSGSPDGESEAAKAGKGPREAAEGLPPERGRLTSRAHPRETPPSPAPAVGTGRPAASDRRTDAPER